MARVAYPPPSPLRCHRLALSLESQLRAQSLGSFLGGIVLMAPYMNIPNTYEVFIKNMVDHWSAKFKIQYSEAPLECSALSGFHYFQHSA